MECDALPSTLLVDSAFSAIPIYKHLIGLGHHVTVVGKRAGDPLAKIAGNNWHSIDYSNLAALEELCDSQQFDYIVPGCTDISIESCQKLARFANFDSCKTNAQLTQKSNFRNLCSSLSIQSPQVYKTTTLPKNERLICKPVDAFSGRGITIFNSNKPDEVSAAIKYAKKESRCGEIVIESFIDGQLYSYSCFLKNQSVAASFIVKEGSGANTFAVDTSYVVNDFPEQIENQIKNSIEKLATSLKLKDGLFHLQFILSKNKAWFIEVTRRCPGDLYSLLISQSTGFDYAGAYASSFIQRDFSYTQTSNDKKAIIRHTISSEKDGYFQGLQFLESQKTISFFPLLNLGDSVLPAQKVRVAIVFLEVENTNKAFEEYVGKRQYTLD
jgi:formate-dependent phosphoribosylglycinamide formyltransferase (GAR transformylase)